MKQFILRWGPALAVMGIIFFASSTSGSDIPDLGFLDFATKKGGHLLGYALLGAALLYALKRSNPVSRSGIFKALISAALYAAFDEWHQSFTPGRNPSFQDVCIDIAGSILGIAILAYLWKSSRISSRESDRDRD
ncbi:MAG: VanZ family protein [Acidobacteriota bacterium]